VFIRDSSTDALLPTRTLPAGAKWGSAYTCVPNGCYNVKTYGGGWPEEVSWWISLVDTTAGTTSTCTNPVDASGKLPNDGGACEGRQLAEGVGGADENQSPISFCTSCMPGSAIDETTDACTTCPKGKYSDTADSAECATCPAGKFSDAHGYSACEDCDSGKYLSISSLPSSHDSASDCTTCPAGKFAATAAPDCTVCGDHLYADTTESSVCTACPPGKFIFATAAADHDAAADCTGCEAGKVFDPVASDCKGCDAGKFATESGVCEYCTSGKYTTTTTTTSECTSCSAGTYAVNSATDPTTTYYGATACSSCPAAKTSVPAAVDCTTCAPGTYSTNPASPACTTCPTHQASTTPPTACEACAAGTEPVLVGDYYICRACQAGYVRDSTAAAEAACKACEVDTFAQSAAQPCFDCPNDTTSDVGSFQCYKACSDGRVENPDTGECACRPGQGLADGNCVACAKSFFSESYTLDACTSCETVITGSVTFNTNSIASSDCECPMTFTLHENQCVCEPGKGYDSVTGTCVSCVNTYKSNYGLTACESCGERKSTGGLVGETTAEACQVRQRERRARREHFANKHADGVTKSTPTYRFWARGVCGCAPLPSSNTLPRSATTPSRRTTTASAYASSATASRSLATAMSAIRDITPILAPPSLAWRARRELGVRSGAVLPLTTARLVRRAGTARERPKRPRRTAPSARSASISRLPGLAP